MQLSRYRLSAALLPHIFLGHFILFCAMPTGATAQSLNDDEVRAVLILARHGIRAPIESELRSSAFNASPWPLWPVEPGIVTPHGTEALRLLGQYYRLRYPSLLDHLSCTRPNVYVEANTVPRTIASAKALLTGIAPECHIAVHVRPGHNSLFSPADHDVDSPRVTGAILGRMSNRPDWYAKAYSRQLDKMYQILSSCSGPVACNAKTLDFRGQTLKELSVSEPPAAYETSVTIAADFAENLLLQYVEGFPMQQVGWGRVTRSDLNDLMELNTRYHDFMLRTPYYAQIAASDLAAHLRATLLSVANGKPEPGQLGVPGDRMFVLDGHDANLTWLGGLLHLDWVLPDQTLNATPPGSALIFELHRSRSRGTQSVRVVFVSQTLDQMRTLNSSDTPSVAPVFVPGCSGPAPHFACSVEDFAHVVATSIDKRYVDLTDGRPGVSRPGTVR